MPLCKGLISALHASRFKRVRLLHAKEQFSQRLLASSLLEPCVIRANGFFSDIEELYTMARSGRAYLFGGGEVRVNPIHGADLANFCLDSLASGLDRELTVGGPDILSLKQIAQLAFLALNKPEKITYLPDWMRKTALTLASCLPERLGGSAEFFLTVSAQYMVAPRYGEHRLMNYFNALP